MARVSFLGSPWRVKFDFEEVVVSEIRIFSLGLDESRPFSTQHLRFKNMDGWRKKFNRSVLQLNARR